MTDITIQNLATFDIGHLPDDHLALLLAYATTPERLARNEMESVVVGLSHDMARRLPEPVRSTKSGRGNIVELDTNIPLPYYCCRLNTQRANEHQSLRSRSMSRASAADLAKSNSQS